MAARPETPSGFKINTPVTIEELQKLPASGPADEANLESLHKWFEQWNADYETFRAAAKRPRVYLPGDYSSIPAVPILNFVAVRTVAQATASKANINLALHHPAEARKDLESIEGIIHLLDSKPRTLVGAMIQVAVAGLYLSVVHDGIEAKLWTPEELKSIQSYVEKLDLLAPPRAAFMEGEKVGVCQMLDASVTPSGAIKTARDMGEQSKVRHLAFAMFPRGWVRRNELYIVGAMDQTASLVDVTMRRYHPGRAKAVGDRFQQDLESFSINRIIASVVIPNFSKAFQTAAKNQAMAHHAAISCALGRYKAAKGSYPDNLSQLQPEFITSLPNDVIGSAPMRYIRKSEGYLLYSIGVNERDDGGDEKNDWVWKI